jgi:hypothetical protein
MTRSLSRLTAGACSAAVAVLLTACGSTVQTAGGQVDGSGLAADVSLGESAGTAGTTGGEFGTGAAGGAVQPDGNVTGGGAEGSSSAPGSTGGGPTTGTSGGGTTGTSGATGVGTGKRAPITIGFVIVDYAKAVSSLGYNPPSDQGTAEQYIKAYVKAYNTQGGFAGRQIKPLFFVVDGTAANYDTAFEAACAYMTQDNKAEIVATWGILNLGFSQCLLRAGVADINGMSFNFDKSTLAKLPNVFNPNGLTHDQISASTIDAAVGQGWLSKTDKLGILLGGCPEHEAIFRQVVEPRLKRLGIAYTTVTPYQCPKGFADVGSMSSGVQNAVLRFRSEGVTTVMYLAYVENVVHILFVPQADSQDYVPKYLLNTNVRLAQGIAAGNFPDRQLPGMRGVGWNPITDLWAFPAPKSAPRTACVDKLKGAKEAPPMTAFNQDLAMHICSDFQLMSALLGITGGSSSLNGLRAAAPQVGQSYGSAMTWGATDFRDQQGPEQAAPFSYLTSCKCVRFVGGPAALGRP